MDNLEIDYKKAAQQLRSGEALFSKDGALAPLLERILNCALEGEMDAHLKKKSVFLGIVAMARCPRRSRPSMARSQ